MTNFQKYLDQYAEFGVVEEVHFPLAFIGGLPNVHVGEIIWFDDDEPGYVESLHKDKVQVALLSNHRVRPGMRAVRAGTPLSIPIGPGQRGQAVTPLGTPLVPNTTFEGEFENRTIDISPPPISARASVKKTFVTGSTAVDLFVPLGAGQREAILGDQKTGKTSFLLATARAHAENGGIVVYGVIGRPWSDVKRVYDFIRQDETSQQNIILVASSANDVPSLITLTPFSAMTIAEYWRDAGFDVLLILHDLSTHAKFYREVALIGGRFPGRESYPGDIFHLHARLLERAGSFNVTGHDSVSITCLPIVETVRSDVTNYIVSNIISITDGHILFDPSRYSQGQRPAVSPGESVTRMGLKAMPKLAKELHRKLIAFLAQYDQAKKYSHFGAELSDDLRSVQVTGARLTQVMAQAIYLNVPFNVQLVISTIVWQGWANDEPEDAAAQWRDRLHNQYKHDPAVSGVIDDLVSAGEVSAFIEQLTQRKQYLVELCHSEKISKKQSN